MNRNSRRRLTRLFAALLVPLLIAGVLLGATWKQQARTERITAALVNDDQMVTVNGQSVPVGRLLADALINNHQSNITWELANDAGGSDGLRDGTYAAVVTIPQQFSADAMSFATDPDHARQASVRVELSQQARAKDPQLAATLLNEATTKLNDQLTQLYLSGLFAGFNDQAAQLSQVTTAAEQLADGEAKVADGNRQLADGLGQTKTGAEQLATGVQQLNEGTQAYVNGVQQYTSGVDQAAAGMQQLNGQLPQLQSGTHAYVDGVNQLTGGIGQLATGAQGVASGLDQLQQTLQGMEQQLPPEVQQAADARSGPVKEQVTQAVLAQLTLPAPTAPQLPTLPPSDFAAAAAQTCAGMSQGMQQAGEAALTPTQLSVCEQAVAQSLATTANTTAQQTADQVIAGAAEQFKSAATQLVTASVGAGVDGGTQLGTHVGWAAGTQAAVQGLNTADPATGMTLAQGAQALASGAAQMSSNTDAITAGGTQLATGVDQLADGVGQLDSGLQQLSASSGQLNTGGAQLSSGLQQLGDQVPQLSSGIGQLADASTQLADGAQQAADGQRQLADGFKNQGKVPTYTDAQRQALSTAIASPVTLVPTDTVTQPNPSTTVLITLVALWIGALATFVARKPLPRSIARGNRSTAGNLGAALLPGLVVVELQAVLLTVAAAIVLRPGWGAGLGLLAVMLVAGAVFMVVNHMLAGAFGWLGRLVSVGIAATAVAVGLTAALPTVFAPLAGISPLTAAVEAAAGVVAHGAGTTGHLLTLVIWGMLALVVSLFTVVRGERVSAHSLLAGAEGL